MLKCMAKEIPVLDPAQWVPRLLESIEPNSPHNSAAAVRAIAVKTLMGMGDGATKELVVRISQPGDDGASWALYVLREAGLQMAAGELIRMFAGTSTEQRETLVTRLTRVCDESWDDLLALMAGVVQRLPRDHRLVDALSERLGRKTLEEKCVQMWTHGRSGDARTLLENYFGYSKSILA
jgi:hypothetical protein